MFAFVPSAFFGAVNNLFPDLRPLPAPAERAGASPANFLRQVLFFNPVHVSIAFSARHTAGWLPLLYIFRKRL